MPAHSPAPREYVPTLRILQITPYAAGAWAYGGIPRAVSALTGALARRGHEVTVATTDVCDASSRLHQPDRGADGARVRVFSNRSNWLAYHWQVFTPRGFRRYVFEQVPRFDVVHVHAHRHWLEVCAAAACEAHGVPFVLTPNGTAPRIERRQVLKAVWDRTLGREVFERAAVVTAVSGAEQRDLLALGVAPERIRLLPNPVDLSEFDQPRRPPPRRNSAHSPTVLFLGKLTPRKGVDVLVRALAQLDSNVRLQIAGNDMGAGRAVRHLARRLRVDSRIEWLGLLRGAERLRALAAADLVAYPSRDEVFGLVAVEALLCGSPVVVGDDSGCAEIVSRVGGGSVVPYGDAEALAEVIRQHLSEPERWHQRAGDAARLVRQEFSADRIAQLAETIYADAAPPRLAVTA